ncbi:MAG TPA: aminoacyl-tRNA hydrolase [Saprospiraceae bacterium]|nr:aminoacyl-tRNA hydrolase [Saprospiraceae bacterium]
MKYLIAGLGNIGSDYQGTRHNIGFDVVDRLAQAAQSEWESVNYAFRSEFKFKGKTIILIKPTTYMNLSGKAVKHHLVKENIAVEQLLVIVDDLHIDFGTIRLRPSGSHAGHNGLRDIEAQLGSSAYPRLRMGIGSEFGRGQQVHFVLGKWNSFESSYLDEIIQLGADTAMEYAMAGLANAMNKYNSKKIEIPNQ